MNSHVNTVAFVPGIKIHPITAWERFQHNTNPADAGIIFMLLSLFFVLGLAVGASVLPDSEDADE